MNYTQEGRRYIADAGYVFALKTNHESTAEVISIKLIDYYDCIPEPKPEPIPEEQEVEDNGESSNTV